MCVALRKSKSTDPVIKRIREGAHCGFTMHVKDDRKTVRQSHCSKSDGFTTELEVKDWWMSCFKLDNKGRGLL